jgi:hypothetical protein
MEIPVAPSDPHAEIVPMKANFMFCTKPAPIFRNRAFWEAVRLEFVAGLGSTRQLSKKYGVSLSATQARCKREGWVDLRAEREENALENLVMG